MSDATPTEIDQDAPVVARHSRDVDAPLDLVWNTHIDVGRWHEWQTDMQDIVPDAPVLHPGGWFEWKTSGLSIRSSVHRVDGDAHETFWGGPANGIDGLHHWRFTALPSGGTRIETQESWSGAPVDADVPGAQRALDGSLVSWLDLLQSRTASGADQPSA